MNKQRIYNEIKGFTGSALVIVGLMILGGENAVEGRSLATFWTLKLTCVPFFYVGGILLRKTNLNNKL